MAWFQKLSSFLSTEADGNKVVEVKSEKYVKCLPVRRNQKGMILYNIDKTYELVLHLPCTQSLNSSFSIFRTKDEVEATYKYSVLEDILPSLISVSNEVCNLKGFQRIYDALCQNPSWNIALLAVHLELYESLALSPVVDFINVEDPTTGITPLLLAVKNFKNNEKTVLVLIKQLLVLNASPEHIDHEGNSVFHYAAETNKDIIKTLADISVTCLDMKNKKGFTPLHMACQAGKPECVKALCAAGANVNIPASSESSSLPGYSPPSSSIGNFLDGKNSKITKEDVKLGGTPLHWCSSREVIEVLVNMGCDINARNFDGAPALHVMILRNRIECVVALLSLNADVNLQDKAGETALHLAVQQKTIHITQALIVFGFEINCLNGKGFSPRHVAASQCVNDSGPDSVAAKILYILHSVGAERCSDQSVNCTDGCKKTGTFCGTPPPAPKSLPVRGILEQIGVNLSDKGPNMQGGRLLCLDGGGIRGLILIVILLHLEKELNYPLVHCFDWIAGTSTGGILALALASGKTLKECLCLYFRMKDIAFCGSRPYDCAPIENLLKDYLGATKVMTDLHHPKLIITGTLADEKPLDLHLFRNYTSPSDMIGNYSAYINPACKNPSEQLVWEAARASAAAPSYFSQFGAFVDGGLISNNPTLDALSEINEYNAALKMKGRSSEVVKPTLVVSIGTGAPPVIDLPPLDVLWPNGLTAAIKLASGISTIGSILVDQATQADGRVVDRAQNWCAMIDVPFFRFNPQLSEDISMDEKSCEKLVNMLWETTVYMHLKRRKVHRLVSILRQNI